jgi:hypothetical protein
MTSGPVIARERIEIATMASTSVNPFLFAA